MKKKRVKLISTILAFLMVFSVAFTGCNFWNDGSQDDTTQTQPTEYVIQYTDDAGAHTIRVKDGEPFALESVPTRMGYDFLGLYDSEVGGTQYVSANGQSLAPYTDKKNMVLFPQWKAKEYTLWLDFAGAEITGSRSYTVTYGQTLPELPKSVYLENQSFKGWFTEEDCGGTQVADNAGLILNKAIVNEKNFDLSDPDGFIYLYAGFEMEKHTVTFYFGSGMQSETVEVEHGTPISEVVPDTRNEDGFAVLSWSERENGGQVFNGDITYDMVLYAVEWAPVIELDTDGGQAIPPIVAAAGARVTLPLPVRENYKFLHWEDETGNEALITRMPEASIKLTAVWQAMLIFDENGGTSVSDISAEAGTAITLPTPTREGYIFAGWYTDEEEKYSVTSMPAEGQMLKAGWYAREKTVIYLIDGDESVTISGTGNIEMRKDLIFDMSRFLPKDFSGNIKVDVSVLIGSSTHLIEDSDMVTIYHYSSDTISDNNLLYSKECSEITGQYVRYTYSFETELSGNIIYSAIKGRKANSWSVTAKYSLSDFYVEVTYPDTSKLYL